jgi:hypothetical protein
MPAFAGMTKACTECKFVADEMGMKFFARYSNVRRGLPAAAACMAAHYLHSGFFGWGVG